MAQWRVHNPTTWHEFGVYEGANEQDALDAMARDAGYADFADACETAGLGAIADRLADD